MRGEPRWVFVSGSAGWILRGMCNEIERHGKLNARHFADGFCLPAAEHYFFAHQSRLMQFLENPRGCGQRTVWFPHFEDHGKRTEADVLAALRQADKVICPASYWRDWLVARGFDPRRVTFILGGADPEQFQGHQRRGAVVGLVARYYPRKRPETVLEIVHAMPQVNFFLVGPGWVAFSSFSELISLDNLEYLSPPYSEFAAIYGRMTVLLSVSRVEGGPIPLLEAMMSNVVPVASRTGFAPDLIRHGENGFLFDVDAGVPEIVRLIEKALTLQADVRESVKHLTWERFTRKLVEYVYA